MDYECETAKRVSGIASPQEMKLTEQECWIKGESRCFIFLRQRWVAAFCLKTPLIKMDTCVLHPRAVYTNSGLSYCRWLYLFFYWTHFFLCLLSFFGLTHTHRQTPTSFHLQTLVFSLLVFFFFLTQSCATRTTNVVFVSKLYIAILIQISILNTNVLEFFYIDSKNLPQLYGFKYFNKLCHFKRIIIIIIMVYAQPSTCPKKWLA